jgi:hypothetical protein
LPGFSFLELLDSFAVFTPSHAAQTAGRYLNRIRQQCFGYQKRAYQMSSGAAGSVPRPDSFLQPSGHSSTRLAVQAGRLFRVHKLPQPAYVATDAVPFCRCTNHQFRVSFGVGTLSKTQIPRFLMFFRIASLASRLLPILPINARGCRIFDSDALKTASGPLTACKSRT